MALRGGKRDRMLLESILQAIKADLTTQGWLDATVYDDPVGLRQHKPIVIVDEFPDEDAEVAENTLAFSWDNSTAEDLEMGSRAENHAAVVFVDFFAESDAVGRHLSGDIYAFLKENRLLPVYDYSLATPAVDFNVDLEDVDQRKPSRAVSAWQKHWYTVSFVAEDDRANA